MEKTYHAYMSLTEIKEKSTQLARFELFQKLKPENQSFLRQIELKFPITHSEAKVLIEICRDLEMWRRESIVVVWNRFESQMNPKMQLKQMKKNIFQKLDLYIKDLRSGPKKYDLIPEKPKRETARMVSQETDKKIIGDCPVYSDKLVCCQLKTIDAVQNCAFGCSYCTIQTFYEDEYRFDSELGKKLEAIELESGKFHHIGTGQSSDSLFWGNKYDTLDQLMDFASKNSNVLLEFKTKSNNVSYFKKNRIPKNIVCSWSLNTQAVIDNEEHFTASLVQRLDAARQVADLGIGVAFHFHPIVYYEGWEKDYVAMVKRVQEMFSPEEILFISFGSVTFIKPVMQKIRERGEPGSILQMDLVPDPHGKLSYSDDVKNILFAALYEAFEPWHNKVFMYLCMEHARFWDKLFGWHYPTNDEFGAAFGVACGKKLGIDWDYS